jgi:aerobic-type carbon monoxide dehydrogenase small subunit (CoxS/CutS family)
MSAIGAVAEGGLDDERAIAEAMSGNICRCGAYPMIRAAVERARV